MPWHYHRNYITNSESKNVRQNEIFKNNSHISVICK